MKTAAIRLIPTYQIAHPNFYVYVNPEWSNRLK